MQEIKNQIKEQGIYFNLSRSNEDIPDGYPALLRSRRHVPSLMPLETLKKTAELQDLEGVHGLMSWIKYRELGDENTAE